MEYDPTVKRIINFTLSKDIKNSRKIHLKISLFQQSFHRVVIKKSQNQYLIKNGILFLIADDRVRFHNKNKTKTKKTCIKTYFGSPEHAEQEIRKIVNLAV